MKFELEEAESRTVVFIKKIADKIELKFKADSSTILRIIWNLMIYVIIEQIAKSACLKNILSKLKLGALNWVFKLSSLMNF